MTNLFLNFLLVLSKLVKIESFITIIILMIVGVRYKKIKNLIICLYILYLEIFFMFFTINYYGTDIFTVLFIKNNMTPNSFSRFKNDISSKKKLEEKIVLSYYLSKDIKYSIKKLEEEINLTEKEFNNIKGIEKKFIPWIDTSDKI